MEGNHYTIGYPGLQISDLRIQYLVSKEEKLGSFDEIFNQDGEAYGSAPSPEAAEEKSFRMNEDKNAQGRKKQSK